MPQVNFSRRQFISAASITLTGINSSILLAHGRSRRRRGFCVPIPSVCTRIRQDIQFLNSSQLASLQRGVAVMKALPAEDPRSWSFQANIHGILGPSTNPLFKQCEHGTLYFLMWHRGYLYFFERILRWASGDDYLTLPYWDWTKDRALPLPFRWPASGSNSLYDGTRSINNGATLPDHIAVDDLNTALGYIPFPSNGPFGFSRSLEESPHGQVHTFTGGNMGSVPTAANDPIFWLHHANIDRLWDYWLNLDFGRANPNDPLFLSKSYSFADEFGSTVSVSVKDLMSSQALGYRYDNVLNPTTVQNHSSANTFTQMHVPAAQDQSRRLAASSEKAAIANQTLATLPSKPLGLKPERVRLSMTEQYRAVFGAPVAGSPERHTGRMGLEIQGISFEETPNFTFAVYLNLPEGETTPEQRKFHYVGSINFFGREHVLGAGHGHGAMQGGKTFDQLLDATATIARLQQVGNWKADALAITLVPLTPTLPSGNLTPSQGIYEETSRRAKITYKRVNLTILP